MSSLMDDTYEYSDLVSKYGNFYVPAVKIKLNEGNSDVISDNNLAVNNIRVSLSLESSSSLSFTISDVYDVKNRKFKQSIKDLFTLSTVIEIEVGYLSSTTLIFKGFIAVVNYSFQSVPEMKITALDVRRLMMLSNNAPKYFDKKKYSDIVSEIMGAYSKFCSMEIDATEETLNDPVAQQMDDYQYITNKLLKDGKLEREFFVLADVAYFRKPKKSKSEIMTLEYGESLLSFSRNVSYMTMDIEVSFKEQTSTVNVTSEDGVTELIEGKQKISMIGTREDSKENVEKMANAIAQKKKSKSQTANGSCIGLPEIVPGRFIMLKKLDSSLDGKYYIVSVEHSVGQEGFQTNFEIKGW